MANVRGKPVDIQYCSTPVIRDPSDWLGVECGRLGVHHSNRANWGDTQSDFSKMWGR